MSKIDALHAYDFTCFLPELDKYHGWTMRFNGNDTACHELSKMMYRPNKLEFIREVCEFMGQPEMRTVMFAARAVQTRDQALIARGRIMGLLFDIGLTHPPSVVPAKDDYNERYPADPTA